MSTHQELSSAIVVPKTYSSDYPQLEGLASGTPEYSASAVAAGSNVSLEDVDNAEKQYKTRRALQMAGLATMDEVLASKKREYELLAENAGRVAMPDWVGPLQQQLQKSFQTQFQAMQASSGGGSKEQSSSSNNAALQLDTRNLLHETQQQTSDLLSTFQVSLVEHQESVQQQVETLTHQLNEIGQTLLQESVRNMNRHKVKNDSDPIYPLPILESTLSEQTIGQAQVVYPKDRGVWFPERFCQIKTIKVKYPAYPKATEYQLDKLLAFYEIAVDTSALKDLEVTQDAIAKEILRYKQEALYHFLGVEWC